MKLNNGVKQFSIVGNWIAKALFSLVAIALVWQGSFFSNINAIAAPSTVIATTAANQVKGAADDVRNRSKDLIQDTKKNVERAANRNTAKVDQADDQDSFVERKAQRDRDRIEQRAEEDASRTERAVDNSMNAVKGAVEKVKEAFGS
jgi:hypothetical protein